MRAKITGYIIATDHLRQSFTVKPEDSAPVRVYAGDKIFTRVIRAVETGCLNENSRTRGTFKVSGKVAVGFKLHPGTVRFPIGNTIVESENYTLYDFVRMLNRAVDRRPPE
jgi:hypothetical protein